jgi:hypothetical protein
MVKGRQREERAVLVRKEEEEKERRVMEEVEKPTFEEAKLST